jgi:hypothetical protein
MRTKLSVAEYNGRKALDRWARDAGWADFDTYISTGGSILECRESLITERDRIDAALSVLPGAGPEWSERFRLPNHPKNPVYGPEELARMEDEISDATADPGNAHIQGGEA